MKEHPLLKLSAAIALVTCSSVAFSVLPACGRRTPTAPPGSALSQEQESSGQGIGSTSDQSIATGSLVQAQRIAREAQVSCAEGVRCPEGVAMVVSTSETSVERCTGFLIAADLLMTSSHCIPADLQVEGANCGGRVRALFPADPQGRLESHEAGCAGLILRAGESHAFIRLNRTLPRRAFEVRADGLGNGLDVSVPAVESIAARKPIGEIRMLGCRVAQRSVVLPQFRTDLGAVGALAGCEVETSAYGAPVIDNRGAVRAIIKSSFQGVEQIQTNFQALLGTNQVADFAFASNLACVRTPLDRSDRALPRDCASGPSPSGLGAVIDSESLATAQAELDGAFAPWKGDPAQKIRWELPALRLSAVTPSAALKPTPVCFQNAARWLKKDHHHWYNFLSGGYESETQIELTIPRFVVRFGLNSFAQSTHEVAPQEGVPVLVTFQPKQLAEKGSSLVSIRIKNSDGRPGPFFLPTTTLSRCK